MTTQLKAPPDSRLKQYGIDGCDWWAQFEAQDGKCALCMKAFTRKRYPVVEHDHRTGEWRGLTCSPCNEKLGADHDDKDWYYNAWCYLDKPPTRDIFLQPRIHVNAPPRSH
jgi:Recombination endonuclease VII